jgi:hypothetical protein
VIAYGRRNPGLSQQDDRGDDNDEAHTSGTFSGQLPVPTSRDSNSYLDCKNPAAVHKFSAKFLQFFDLTGAKQDYAMRIN